MPRIVWIKETMAKNFLSPCTLGRMCSLEGKTITVSERVVHT